MGCASSTADADRGAVAGSASAGGDAVAASEAAAAAAVLGSALGTFSFVDLSIAASGLPKLDLLSQSDPMCVVFEGQRELGRTEMICTHLPLLHPWRRVCLLQSTPRAVDFPVRERRSA
jgi:hypothetical protein